MKQTILLIVSLVFFLFGCNNKKETNVDLPTSEKKTEEKHSLIKGIEAMTNQNAALWSEKELKVLEGPDWTKANASIRLKSGAVVYVSDVGNQYAKVITLIGHEGYIVKSLLNPIINNALDSSKYYLKKKIATINTFVEGSNVGTVNLWENMTSRDKIVDQLSNGETVAILQEQGEYVKLSTINGKVGWCMKGFIK